MKPPHEWRSVLDAEMKRWLAMSSSQLISRLPAKVETYEVEYKSKKYQVEVTILENTATYIHVAVAVDDGHFGEQSAHSPPVSSARRALSSEQKLGAPAYRVFCEGWARL